MTETRTRSRKYLNKDFEGFRADLIEHAQTYFPEKVRDFSSNGLAGLVVELCSYVGDVQSFYLDHQFRENDPELAVEPTNIKNHLRKAGVKVVGASPAVVPLTFYAIVPSNGLTPAYPKLSTLPVIQSGTTALANNGVMFELVEDVDFGELGADGKLRNTTIRVISQNNDGVATSFELSKEGLGVSGQRFSDSFTLSGTPFQKVSLTKRDVSTIISASDNLGNIYYEVGSLTQDSVFEAITNRNADNELVKDLLIIRPALYRFTSEMSYDTRITSLTFGSGTTDELDTDIVPDPGRMALPLFGKRNFARFSISPANLLRTSTLGTVVPNSTLTVTYRYGGGLNHSIPKETMSGLDVLRIAFPGNPTSEESSRVRETVDVQNLVDAIGGDDAPTLDELKTLIPAARSSQERIASKEDLLARIYTLPSNFGRIYRASAEANPVNANSSIVYLLSKGVDGQLAPAPDSLKKNLARYINLFRLVTDGLDFLDGQVVNIQVKYSVTIESEQNKQIVLQEINRKLRRYFAIQNWQIGQYINLSEVQNLIFNTQGVLSFVDLSITNVYGTVGSKVYSSTVYDTRANVLKGNLMFPPRGGIFEVKYPAADIFGVGL
jgi:hypothetical protein